MNQRVGRGSAHFKPSICAIAILTFFGTALSTGAVHAVVYNTSKIISIDVNTLGEVYVRWDGLPDPGPCGGENYHWVVIPAGASDTLKSLALSLYFSGKSARIDTAAVENTPAAQQPTGACAGPYENVTSVYSPSGG